MKKIIDGKIYDTEKATELGYWHNHYFTNDFHYCEETLYRTETGAYFLHGHGGPLSTYSVPVGGNGMGGGDGIRPLTEAEAFQWAEKKLHPDLTLELFPSYVEEA